MQEFTTAQFIAIVFGGGGIIVGLVSLLSFIATQLDNFRARKKTAKDIHESESATILKIRSDDSDKTFNRLWQMLEAERENISDLKKQMDELQFKLETSLKRESVVQDEFIKFREENAKRIQAEYDLKVENEKLSDEVLKLKNSSMEVVRQYEMMLGKKDVEIKTLCESVDLHRKEIEKIKRQKHC